MGVNKVNKKRSVGGAGMTVRILHDADTPIQTVQMSKSTARKAGLSEGREIFLSYGMRQVKVKVQINKHATGNVFLLSSRVIERLRIALWATYNVCLLNDLLVIGPVIGMLYRQNGKKMAQDLQENADLYLPYAQSIKKLGGLLFFAAEDQIDYKSSEIEGFAFDFESMSWKKSVFPFPAVLYRKIKSSKPLKNTFGSRLLNPPCYYKWKFFTILNEEPAFRRHLPETTNVISKGNLDKMLTKYRSVFLKPINQGGGAGMHLIWRENGKYFARQNFTDKVFTYSPRQMNALLVSCEKNHILQQAINLKTHDDRKIDYRVVAVKEMGKTWKVEPIIGWLGEKGGISIQSHKEINGRYADDMLKLQFNYSPEEIAEKLEEMASLGIALAKYLEGACGRFIDFGFDMGLDENGDIYVFEGNTLQQLQTPLWLDDHMMYGKLIHTIIEALKEIAMEG